MLSPLMYLDDFSQPLCNKFRIISPVFPIGNKSAGKQMQTAFIAKCVFFFIF
jgi:hypothetical protein